MRTVIGDRHDRRIGTEMARRARLLRCRSKAIDDGVPRPDARNTVRAALAPITTTSSAP